MSEQLNAGYWNQRYLNDAFGWDIGHISTPLKTYIDQLQNKQLRILIPGAGNAYEAEYLVQAGFKNVVVCDYAEQALQNFKNRCPDFKPEHLLLGDFFEIQNQKFDLILEQTFFCALNPQLRKSYFEKMHTLLNPGAKLVGLLFDNPMNRDEPPYGGSREEYLDYLNPLFSIHTFEACYNSIKPRQGKELFMNLIRRD